MPAFAQRFVGRESLPSRLSDFDLQQFFQFTHEDIEAIRGRFRSDRRVAASLQLLFLRACGRPLERFAVLPRNLLRYVSEALGSPSVTIASLRTLYQRRPTQYEHQLWAKTYLGLDDLHAAAAEELFGVLRLQAKEASHTDDLVTFACRWLYDRSILIPGERRVQDWARDAFAEVEAEILDQINTAVPPAMARSLIESAYSTRQNSGITHLEWLKTPSKRHGPSTLAETLEKVRYLKSVGAEGWDLDGVALVKQQAYARQVQVRRPAKTREIKATRQTIELVCFLRVTLLELTDIALMQSGRRSQQLFREAADRAQAGRIRGTTALLQQATKARPSCTTN